MSSSSSTASSSSSVAGQQLWSSKASQDLEEIPTGLANTNSTDGWDVQEIVITHSYDEYESSLGSPETPDLLWDSRPSSGADFSETMLESVFDKVAKAIPATSSIEVIEEDGSQVLLIPADNAFFHPPPTPKPFGFSHLDFHSNPKIVIPPRRDSIAATEEAVKTPVVPRKSALIERTPEHHDLSDLKLREDGSILFVDTMLLHPSFGHGVALSPYYSPGLFRSAEVSSLEPKNPAWGPDVPLDCIYSAGDISEAERWDEHWSPVLLTSSY